jgi:hypothetical protein
MASNPSENSEVPEAMPVPMPTAMTNPDEVGHVLRYQTPPSKSNKKGL